MHRAIRGAQTHGAILFSCILAAVALVGCDQSATIAPSPTAKQSSTWTPTATVLVPSVANWQTYTDPTYHFTAVIPPGWHLSTYLDTRDAGGGNCEYDVLFSPPGDTRQAGPYVRMQMHEFMFIEVVLNCPGPNDGHLIADRNVRISGTPTTVYRGDDSTEVQRIAEVAFGGHNYDFILSGTSLSHTPLLEDIPLYFGMLSGFQYWGA
jgi:hypothetical protein